MTATGDRRRARWVNLLATVAVPVCLAAGAFELTRALAGNVLSWVYTIEWPLFAVFFVYLRRQLVAEAMGHAPRRARASAPSPSPDPKDVDLAAWNDYLVRLHAASPPGGPDVESVAGAS